jgi:phenylpyruvate tautomerase PptA (4-oxalocrotonate tautomerase family)
MPYLQLDLPRSYPLSVKQDLAKRMGDTYAEIMQTTPDLVAVAFRELGDGNMWRCRDAKTQPVPGAVLACEIRRGRSAEQREHLAEALFNMCAETLNLDPLILAMEFTQHAGDENYLQALVDGVPRGGLGRDWTPEETSVPMMKRIADSMRDAKKGNDAALPIPEMECS